MTSPASVINSRRFIIPRVVFPRRKGQRSSLAVPDWVCDFEIWLQDRLQARDWKALLEPRFIQPLFRKNHPTVITRPRCWSSSEQPGKALEDPALDAMTDLLNK